MAPPTSQRRIDANRRNAQKSSGPRTPEGKSRSRFNRLQHGLAATVRVLPGEDPAAFQARVDAVVESLNPQNQLEFDLLERVAAGTWSFERATRAESARLGHNVRHDAIEREQREKEAAVTLGQRLLWDARGPWQLFPHSTSSGLKWERRISWSEDPADPNNPALLVLRLERTVAGCRWLLDRWAELRARLEPGEVWVASDQFKSVRLLGKQPLDAVDDPDVAQIFLASFKLLPAGESGDAFTPLECELMENRHEGDVYDKELRRRQISKLTPPDADSARAVLGALVDRQTSRLKLILARNHEIAEADAAEAPNRLAFDPSPEGDKLRRYVLSAARLVNQTLNTLIKVRKGLDDSSVVSGPLYVEDLSVFGGPLSVEDSSAVRDPFSVLDSSVVSGPLSVADQDDPVAAEVSASRGLAHPAAGGTATFPGLPPTEPNSGPDGISDDGQRTRDNGHPTPIPRTEPTAVPERASDNGQRTRDNGQSARTPRTEPNATWDSASDRGASTNSGPGNPDWAQIRKDLTAQVNECLERLNRVRPPAPVQPTSRENRARAGPTQRNKGRPK